MRRARNSTGLCLLIGSACQPGGLRADRDTCFPEQPAPGEVLVARVRCDPMTLSRGEERPEDWWLANNRYRAVIRNPQASLTLVGVGGGTLIDAAPWGLGDWLHEVAPLVGGGGLRIDEAQTLDDGVVFRGTVVSLPDLPVPEGAPAEVRWRVLPDDPWLHLDGADGIWLHVSAELALHDGWFWSETQVYGHDGTVVSDLGGALRIEGATRLLATDPITALAERAGNSGVPLSGTAPGATRLDLLRDGEVVGLVPVNADGTFEAMIPSDVASVRPSAPGRAYGPRVPPGTQLVLSVGGTGSVEVRPGWAGGPQRPVMVDWFSFDGRRGVAYLPPTGGSLFLGFGAFELTVSAGPTVVPVTIEVEIDGVLVQRVVTELLQRFDPGEYVLGALGAPVDRSRTSRDSDLNSARTAKGLGADFTVFAPEDDVANVSDTSTSFPQMSHENGSLLTAPGGSWTITSWPWTATPHRPGRGAVDPGGLSPEDALAAAVGGVTRDRHTVVSASWLAAAPAPWLIDPLPEGVRLDPPGVAGPSAWADWYRWLDAGVPLSPVGPLTWFPVADSANASSEDVLQAFTAGRSIATTGPLVRLTVAGASPGDIASTDPALSTLATVWIGGARDIDHLALVGEGGAILASWDLGADDQWQTTALLTPGKWALAVAWDDQGDAFAATAPVWIDPP